MRTARGTGWDGWDIEGNVKGMSKAAGSHRRRWRSSDDE